MSAQDFYGGAPPHGQSPYPQGQGYGAPPQGSPYPQDPNYQNYQGYQSPAPQGYGAPPPQGYDQYQQQQGGYPPQGGYVPSPAPQGYPGQEQYRGDGHQQQYPGYPPQQGAGYPGGAYDPNMQGPVDPNAQPGERGFMGGMGGAALGAFTANKFGAGTLGTLMGAVGGGFAGSKTQDHFSGKKKDKKKDKKKKKDGYKKRGGSSSSSSDSD